MTPLSDPKAKVELGQGGTNTRYGEIQADEFIRDLKGKRAIKTYREMLGL